MKSAIIRKSAFIQKSPDIFQVLINYIFIPIKFGLIGFSLAFTLLIIVKTFAYLLKYNTVFTVGLNDVSLSFFGFLIVFMVRFLQNFKVQK